MTHTLESMFNNLGCCDELAERRYDIHRAVKIVEIRNYIVDYMKEPHHSLAVAEAIMSSAEEMGRISGDTLDGELASRYTRDGNPIVLCI